MWCSEHDKSTTQITAKSLIEQFYFHHRKKHKNGVLADGFGGIFTFIAVFSSVFLID